MFSKKFKTILMIISGGLALSAFPFALSSCGKEEPKKEEEPVIPDGDPCPEGDCVDDDEDGFCDKCHYPVEVRHATKVKGVPTAPFFLKVGEERTIQAKLDPKPSRTIEKPFTWTNSSTKKAQMTVQQDTAYAVVKGLEPGEVTFKATNDYNPGLSREFYATVIDFNDESNYLWEYNNEDKSQFGYTADNTAGIANGTAVLNHMSWNYSRSAAISLNLTKGGMIGFGKGSDPETLVTLKAENDRAIKRIAVETGSANGLANITVKVGDNEVINTSSPKSTDDEPTTSIIYKDSLESPNKYSGDILIQFDTPAFDPSRADDDTYKKPGAVYLKSIWIEYYELEYKSSQTYNFEEMYADPESEISKQITSTTGKEFILEDDHFVINFKRVRKSDDKGNEFFETNSDIIITPKESNEVIKYVEFNWETLASKKYTLKSSVFNGELFPTTYVDSNNGKLSTVLSEVHADSVLLESSNTSYVGLKSIVVKTVIGEQLKIENVKLEEGATPTKVNYFDGDPFDPTGLGDILVSFTNHEIPVFRLPISFVTFYDGPSYETPSDHSGKTTLLSSGTTYVVGPILGFDLKVEGLNVKLETFSLSLVKNVADIKSTDTYFVTSPDNHAFVLGSTGTNITKTAGCQKLPDVTFGDTLELSSSYKNDGFYIIKDSSSGLYTIQSIATEYKFGIGAAPNYNDSAAKTPPLHEWQMSIDTETGVASIIMNPEEGVYRYLTCNGSIIKPYAEVKGNIAIYKANK